VFDSITGLIGRNPWLWTMIGLAVAALGIVGLGSLGKGHYMAEIITVAAMFAGTTLTIISQRGLVHPAPVDDDAD
jgi:hypothetical protein